MNMFSVLQPIILLFYYDRQIIKNNLGKICKCFSKKSLMKIYKFFLILLISFFSLSLNANVIHEKIYTKYNTIFSNYLLSEADVQNYQKTFELQDSCEWKKANKHILLIENKILMGHILAQRYLHPRCYKSKFLELTYWLKKYNDHPQAKRIYRLAVKRMPKGYKSPNKPIKPIGIEKEDLTPLNNNSAYKSKKKLSKNQRIEKQKLINLGRCHPHSSSTHK